MVDARLRSRRVRRRACSAAGSRSCSARPASLLVGVTALLAGGLLLSGASYGALLRRSHHAVRRAVARPEKVAQSNKVVVAPPPALVHEPPVDVVHDYPDVVSEGLSEPPPLLLDPDGVTDEQTVLFDAPAVEGAYVLPDRAVLEVVSRDRLGREQGRPAHRGDARDRARALRRRGDDRRPDRRAARDPLRAPAGARDEGLEGRRAQGRPLLRARDDRDPHPRADPGQAGRRRRGAEPLAEDRHARRHLRRPPVDREPARRLARQGHLRQRGLGGSRPDAAHPDRRHDRLGQVRLHQHDPDLGAAPLDARRGADDPDRPEADRAQLLRVDPAPADAGRLEPEGGERRPRERGRGDGAPLRAPLDRARPQPARGEPRLPGPGRGSAPVPAGRDRRARRPDDDQPAGGRGRRSSGSRRSRAPSASTSCSRPSARRST